MSRHSESGAKLLATYRDASALRPDARARTLRKLQARLAAGDEPQLHIDASVPELPSRASKLSLLRVVRVRHIFAGTLLAGAALMSWFDSEAKPAQPSAEVARLQPPTAAIAGSEPQRQQDISAEVSGPTAVSSPLMAAQTQEENRPPATASSSGTSRAVSVASERLPWQPNPTAKSRETSRTISERVSSQPQGSLRSSDNVAANQDVAASSPAAPSAVSTTAAVVAIPASDSRTSEAPAAKLRRADQELQGSAATPGERGPAAVRVPARRAEQLAAASLERETELMEQAQAALRRGDAQRALNLLAEHTWRFPAGHLAEARDVARILALCQAGHGTQARARAQSFLATRASSPFAARVRTSCPEGSEGARQQSQGQ